jgi:hypothetical protein
MFPLVTHAVARGAPTGGMEPHKENIMAVITMRQMLEAGAHFGHQTRR